MSSLWIIVAAAGCLAVLVNAIRTRRQLRAWLGHDPLGYVRGLRAAALIAAIASVTTALWIAATTPLKLTGAGADVILTFDVSRSMGSEDVAPSRIRRAVRKATHIVEAGDGVRLGLVVFAGDAFVALPLTQDRDALLTYLRALDTETVSMRGSDLARALEVSARAFDPGSNRPRSIVLLTDGEHAGPDIGAALSGVRSLGVRVTIVGFGTPEGAEVPGPGGRSLENRDGQIVRSVRDDALLRGISAETDGRYLREFEDRPGGADLLPTAGEMRRSESEASFDPVFALAVFAALALSLEMASSLAAGGGVPRLFRRARGPAIAATALALLGAFGPLEWLAEGDLLLETGDAQAALSKYHAFERERGEIPESRLRAGNAYYRMERWDPAIRAYLKTLRGVKPEDGDVRFAASFNLGNALLANQRFDEAYDAFWTALMERPDSLEAKFNYEFAGEHVVPPPPLPAPDASPAGGGEEGESETPTPDGSGAGGMDARERATEKRSTISETEAQRWLSSLEEEVAEPLQRQITGLLEGRNRAGGQTW